MSEEGMDFKQIITDLIQKQMVILGPKIALDSAKKVPGLSLSEDGTALSISGNPQMVLKALANEYLALSGQISQMTINTLLEKYPNIKI